MIVQLLGTGTSQGIPVIGCTCEVCTSSDRRNHRLRCSVLIKVDGQHIVIDTGPDFRQQMLRAKVDHVEGILITHEHNDHIVGLDDIRPFNFRSEKDMPVYAESSVQKKLKERFGYIFEANPYPGAPRVLLNEIIEGEEFWVNQTKVVPIRIMHGRLPIFGFRIKDFTYLTDIHTIADTELEKVKHTKVLVISALHREVHHSHLSLSQALELIERIKPEVAYLTHLSHRMGLHAAVEQELPKNVYIGTDNMELKIE